MDNIYYLNQQSPKYPQTHGYIQLKPHQEAMLYRCMQIEHSNDVGVMADSPGSGKTYVILSLIMMDMNSINVVVVPQNIYTQWEEAIKKFCGESIRYAKFITYNDVSSLYFRPSTLNSNIILTTPLYYNVIIDALHERKKVSRVIVDEIDSVVSLINSNKKIYDMIWFVSASVTKATLTRMGFYLHVYESITVKCQDDFVKESFNIPEPMITKIICHNVLIDQVLQGLVSAQEYSRLNAMDFNGIKKLNSIMVAKNEKEAVEYFLKDLIVSKEIISISIEETKKVLESTIKEEDIEKVQVSLQEKEKKLKDIDEKINCLTQRLTECNICNICYCDIHSRVITVCCKNSYCQTCLTTWNNKSVDGSCPTCRSKNVEVIIMDEEDNQCKVSDTQESNIIENNNDENDEEDIPRTKMEHLKDMLTNKLGEKVIIFADYTSIFKEISLLLEKENIKFVELDGGNINSIDKDVNEYKNGEVRVLMTNSSLYGCGMNLENTTDVVILHKINESMKEQVIGRAQRPGRISVLNVWELLHGNEV